MCISLHVDTFLAQVLAPFLDKIVEFSRSGSPKHYEDTCKLLHKLSKSKSLSPAQNYLILTMPLGRSFVFLSLMCLHPDAYLLHIHSRHSGPVPYLHRIHSRHSGPVQMLPGPVRMLPGPNWMLPSFRNHPDISTHSYEF